MDFELDDALYDGAAGTKIEYWARWNWRSSSDQGNDALED